MTDHQPPPPPPGDDDRTHPAPSTPAATPPAWPAAPGQPYQPYPPMAGHPGAPLGPPSRAMAIIALVCAILGLFVITLVVAVVLAIIVLSQLRTGRVAGKGMAIAALVVSGVWIVLFGLVAGVAVFDEADRDESGAITEEGSLGVTRLQVGDCMSGDIIGKTNYSVDVLPCSQTHTYEAFANFELPDGDFPGADRVAQLSDAGCVERFTDYVGKPFEESTVDLTYLFPIEDSWSIDRGVTCLVTDGETTGSLQGVGR